MSRAVCQTCGRPQKVCICDFIQPIENLVEIGILQHPSEVKQIKGTALIAQLSLNRSQLWVGEDLTELPGLVDWLKSSPNIYLLYPEIDNQEEAYSSFYMEEVVKALEPLNGVEAIKVLVLDGTWRKTFKIMQLNPQLRALNRIELNPVLESKYRVRKQRDTKSLSTVEAIYEVLSQLESNAEKYQPLLDAFDLMQNQQLAFR